MKLTLDQKETLKELAASEAWESVIAYIEIAVERQRQDVLKCKLEDVIAARQRLEGAERVATIVRSLKEEIKEK